MSVLEGKNVVFTGTLSMKRTVATEMAKKRGAVSVGASITKKTDIVVAGGKAGAKVDEARAKGLTLLSEEQFTQACETSGASQPSSCRPAVGEKTRRDEEVEPKPAAPQRVVDSANVAPPVKPAVVKTEAALKKYSTGKAPATDVVEVELVLSKKLQPGNAHLELLKPFANLKRLTVKSMSVNDEGLPGISNLQQLEYINLSGSSISDAGLEHLRGLKQLKTLLLNDTGVTDEAAARLATELRLEMVGFRISSTTDVAHIGTLQCVKHLVFQGKSDTVSDEVLEQISSLSGLESVHIMNCNVTERYVDALSKIDGLQALRTSGGGFYAEDPTSSGKFSHLQTFEQNCWYKF